MVQFLIIDEMDKETYLEFRDFTTGLYEQALQLLEPGSNDFSILSGSILLIIGLEKLVKYVLYARNPVMILYKKIEFEDLIKLEKKKNLIMRIPFPLKLRSNNWSLCFQS